jgi:hypothetical protein
METGVDNQEVAAPAVWRGVDPRNQGKVGQPRDPSVSLGRGEDSVQPVRSTHYPSSRRTNRVDVMVPENGSCPDGFQHFQRLDRS